MDNQAYAEGMALYKAHGGKNLDEFTIEAWFQKLRDISAEDWVWAVNKILDSNSGEALCRMNFPLEIKAILKSKNERARMSAWKETRKGFLQEPQADPAKVKEFVDDFCRGIKSA